MHNTHRMKMFISRVAVLLELLCMCDVKVMKGSHCVLWSMTFKIELYDEIPHVENVCKMYLL